MANAPQPVRRARPLVPTPTSLPTPGGPGAPPAKPVPHASGAPRRAELPAAGPARPLARAGPGGAAAGPPARQRHHSTAKGKQRRGWCQTGLHELRSGGLDGGLQTPRPRYHGAQAVQASGPHGAGVRGRGHHHGSCGGVAGATAAPRPLPRHASPPAGRNERADGTPHGGAAIGRRGALLADGGEGFVQHHGPAQIAGSIQGPQRDAPHPWHATLRGRTRVWDAGGGTPPPRPQQGEALVLQTAGCQAILHGHAGGYGSHVLAGGRWTVWHSTARQAAFLPLPYVDWQQGPTQAYYMSADPWPLAVLLHTVSAPNKRHEPGWVNPPALVWSPNQEKHLRAAWQGDAIRATDVPDLHEGPIGHARPAATLAVAQRGQQNPQWVVCMFSPADAHIVVCEAERLPGPKAVVRVADCTRMIVKALRGGEHHALLLQVRLKDNARAAKPGVWPAAAHPADLELQLAVPTTVYHWLQAFHDLRWKGQTRLPNRRHALASVAAGRRAARRRQESRTRARNTSSRLGSLGSLVSATNGSTGQPALRTSNKRRHPEVGAAPPSARGHGTNEMPPVCRQVLHKQGNAETPGVARSARCSPGGRQGGGLQHPARKGTEVPMARPVRPAPPAPGGRPRRRP